MKFPVVLFFKNEGPMIRYKPSQNLLQILDLNPEINLARWSISRKELFQLGLACIKASVWPPKEKV